MTAANVHSNFHFESTTFTGTGSGPRLIVLGAVHGNETCGPKAIGRVLADIEAGALPVTAGAVTFVPVTNPLAYQRKQRMGDRNLNRNLSPTTQPADFEDCIANWLCPLLAQHDVLLDLHSTRAQNPPFAMLGPKNNDGPLEPFAQSESERALARRLGVHRFVDGWLSTYAKGVDRRIQQANSSGSPLNPLNTDPRYGIGTTEYMRSVGGYSITLECGQHDDPASIEVGDRAIRNVLAYLAITPATPPAEVAAYEALRMYEVHDRNHADDSFARPWASFDRLTKGDLIGTRHDGTQLVAEADGCILFPDALAAPGNEWFYLAKSVPAI